MKKIVLLIIVFFSFVLTAQPPQRFYTKFGGPGIDIGYGVKQTFNKQYIVAGSTTSFGAGNADAYLVLLDSMGTVLWDKTFGGALSDVAKCIIVNPQDSGFILGGYTASFGNGGYDFYVVRTDKSGNLKWQVSAGGEDWDFASDVTFSSDGNIIICGNTYSFGYGKNDGYVVKLNINNGALIWQKYFGGIEDDDFRSVQLTSDGFYSLAGNTKSYGDLNSDFWLFKIDNVGDSVSSKNFGHPNKGEICYDFMEDNLGKLAFCGSYDTSYYNTGKNEGYLIKTDLNGTFLTDMHYTGAGGNDKFLSVCKATSNDNYFFSRSVFKPGFAIEIQPFYTNINFIFINSNTYIGNKEEEAFEAINTTDDGFAMVGYTKSFGLVSEDIFFLKLDNSLMNSSSIVGVSEYLPQVKKGIYYFENYIHFDNTSKENINYTLINSMGELIKTGVTNSDKIEIPKNILSGVYFIQIGDNKSYKFIKCCD